MKRILVAVLLAGSTSLRAADTPAILGHLETQDRVITLYAGQSPRYSVRTKAGKTLAERISLQELNAKFPDLRPAMDGSYAGWAGL
jgi:hypothetical protein